MQSVTWTERVHTNDFGGTREYSLEEMNLMKVEFDKMKKLRTHQAKGTVC